jgi:DNA-binding SARP family transcriptional activator/tetratricopeptide (TPR) repeat protein
MGHRRVEVRLLGGFGVVVDGKDVGDRWPSRRPAELVQLLALSPAHRLLRDEVIEALWPHLGVEAGGANLRKAAHLARRVLDDETAIVLKQQQVLLFPEAMVTTDVEEFLAAGELAVLDDDVQAAAAAIARYNGELLPSARYEDWANRPRQLVIDRYLDLLRFAGRWDLLVEHDATDEPAIRQAMRAAIDEGHRHRAIALYGRHRQALQEQLGVVPSTETEDLYRVSRSGLVQARRTIMGRHRELATIDALLADADVGAYLLAVSGAAGIGKSALMLELVERAERSEWITASITADDPNDAYTALASVLDGLVDGRRDVVERLDPRSRSVLAMLMPIAGAVEPLELPLTRHQVLGAVQRLIGVLGEGRGVAIVIDDADRADASSLEALAMLGDRDLGRLLVAVSYREPSTSPALDRALTRASRIRPPTVLRLGPLEARDVEALAREIDPSIDASWLDTVRVRSEGVPFFVVELAGARHDGTSEDAVRGAIESRVVDLDELEVAWLRRMAIAGGPLDLDAVLAMTGCTEAEADQLLDRSIASGLLVVDEHGYRFRHELVRAALADRLAPHQRAAVHRDAARRLAELGARPGRIAVHWAEGHRPAEAADWFVRAAEEAIRLGGYVAAVGYLDDALQRVAGHPAALIRRAQALDALGDPRALAAYDAAMAVAPPDDARELKPLQALAQIKGGDPRGAVTTIAGADPHTLQSQVAHALTMSGAALLGATEPDVGTRLSEAARLRALQSGDPAALVVAAWSQAAISHARGELRESLWADLADTRGLPQLALTVFDGQLCITQRLLYGNRPYDDVIRFTNEFAAEAQRIGAARGVAFATTLRGEAELLSGQLDIAERDLWEGVRLHREMCAPTGESFSLQRLAELAHLRHDDEQARELLDEALAVARLSDVGFHLFDRIYGTRIQLATSPQDALAEVMEAEAAVRGPLETCPGCRITLDVPAAIAAANAGDFERLERYEQTCTFLADVVMRLPAWDAALEEVRASACRARGDITGAATRFAKAAVTFEQVGQPFDAERCRVQAAALD